MRHVRSKTDKFALVENRRKHAHVGRMGTAAEIRMIDNEGIAFCDFVRRIALQNRMSAVMICAHVQWQYDMLCNHVSCDI